MVEEITRLCKERGMTVTALSVACGMRQNAIYRWDEHIPSVDKVQRVADALDVTVDELIAHAEFTQRDHEGRSEDGANS